MRHWFAQFWALSLGRVVEMVRDRSTLMWNLLFPLLLILVFAYAFDEQRARFTVVAPKQFDMVTGAWYSFLHNRLIHVRYDDDPEAAIPLLERHQIDMIVDPLAEKYWVNQASGNGYILEKMLLQMHGPMARLKKYRLAGEPLRYVDWVFPGVLALNLMFSALWGVGYAIVRYRRNGVLRRFQASGISALQYLLSQLGARLLVMVVVGAILYLGLDAVFDFPDHAALPTLLAVYIASALALLALGVFLSSMTRSEELASGLVNVCAWPLMLFSEIWFSLQSAPHWVQEFARFSPLWHSVSALRAVMYEGAGLSQVSDHLMVLAAMSVVLLALGAKAFRWR